MYQTLCVLKSHDNDHEVTTLSFTRYINFCHCIHTYCDALRCQWRFLRTPLRLKYTPYYTNRCVFPRNAFNMCSCRNCSFQKLLIYIYFIYIYSSVNLFNEIIVEFLQIVILIQHAFLFSPFLFFPSLLFRLNETNF